MNIQTIELFTWVEIFEEKTTTTRVLRHTITQPSGLIYFQDEYLKHYMPGGAISSERTPWNMLETPVVPDEPVGTFEYAGLFGAVMRSGKAYLYAAKAPNPNDEDEKIAFEIFQRTHRIHEWPHEWVKFAGGIPETLSRLGESKAK